MGVREKIVIGVVIGVGVEVGIVRGQAMFGA